MPSRRFLAGLVLLSILQAQNGMTAESPRTDLYGDPLPPGAVARLGTIRLRHAGAAVTFSKDGTRLISCGCDDGEVRAWDAATGKLLRRQRLPWKPRHQDRFLNVVLSPGGTIAAAWDGETVYVHDTTTGKKRCQLPVNPGGNEPLLTFSPDGKWLAVQVRDQGSLDQELWDVREGKKHQTLAAPTLYNLSQFAFAPDGKCLAGIVRDAYVCGRIHVWDTSTGKELRKGPDSTRACCIAYAPDGKTLAAVADSGDKVWLLDAVTLKAKTTLEKPANDPIGRMDTLVFSPDGRLLAGTSPDSFARNLLIWSLKGSKEPRLLRGGFGCWGWFEFSPDGKRLASYTSPAIRLWDIVSGRQLLMRPGHSNRTVRLTASADGRRVVSWDAGRTLWLWETATGKPLHALRMDEDDDPSFCLFSSDGKHVVSGGSSGTLRIWDAATGKEERSLRVNEGDCTSILFFTAALCSDGQSLATVASDVSHGNILDAAKLRVWDLTTGKQRMRQRLYRPCSVVRPRSCMPPIEYHDHAAFSPDGARVTVWLGDRVGIEDVASGALLATLPADVKQSILFSPDGRLVAAPVWQPKPPSKGVECLSLIEAASGEEIVRLETGAFAQVAFAPDGRAIIVAQEQKLSVWDAATGARLYRMRWPESLRDIRGQTKIDSLAALPGGRAATSMAEGDILIWDLASSTWPVRQLAANLGREELDALWSDLAGPARKAQRAIDSLAAAPARVIPLLGQRLQPAAEVDSKRLDQWLMDLDSDDFSARESASRELAGLCDRIEPRLRRALRNHPSLEMRRRLEDILTAPRHPSAERLRTLRAIAVLERIGTPEAQQLLDKLAGGAAAPETRAAQASLQRLKHRDEWTKGRSSP